VRAAEKAHREQLHAAAAIPQQRSASNTTARAVAQAVHACQVTARADEPTAARAADADAEGDSWAR